MLSRLAKLCGDNGNGLHSRRERWRSRSTIATATIFLPCAILAEFGLAATFFVPTGFIETDHVFAWDMHLPRLANLTWDDVREMSERGFEIGSHTVTHANLGRVSLASGE